MEVCNNKDNCCAYSRGECIESLCQEYAPVQEVEDTLSYNVGKSDYSKHAIQPWHIWLEYKLNPWDADIVKRVLRTKKEAGKSKRASRRLDYEKIIHIAQDL